MHDNQSLERLLKDIINTIRNIIDSVALCSCDLGIDTLLFYQF